MISVIEITKCIYVYSNDCRWCNVDRQYDQRIRANVSTGSHVSQIINNLFTALVLFIRPSKLCGMDVVHQRVDVYIPDVVDGIFVSDTMASRSHCCVPRLVQSSPLFATVQIMKM